jgi:hypothetical protein
LEDNCKIPLPFKLNCWKHHAGFIARQIKKVKSEEEMKNIPYFLLKIGESQMDLYLGKLTPFDLTKFTKKFLKEKKHFKFESYEQWLFSEESGYRLITMPDKSIWTLRMGNQKENYIHLHPGRYSMHTIRVRALTIKTAICVVSYLTAYKIGAPDLQLINKIRKEFLNAEPVKSLSSSAGLRRLINVFNRL